MPELPDVTVYLECLERRIVGEPLPQVGRHLPLGPQIVRHKHGSVGKAADLELGPTEALHSPPSVGEHVIPVALDVEHPSILLLRLRTDAIELLFVTP